MSQHFIHSATTLWSIHAVDLKKTVMLVCRNEKENVAFWIKSRRTSQLLCYSRSLSVFKMLEPQVSALNELELPDFDLLMNTLSCELYSQLAISVPWISSAAGDQPPGIRSLTKYMTAIQFHLRGCLNEKVLSVQNLSPVITSELCHWWKASAKCLLLKRFPIRK